MRPRFDIDCQINIRSKIGGTGKCSQKTVFPQPLQAQIGKPRAIFCLDLELETSIGLAKDIGKFAGAFDLRTNKIANIQLIQ